MMLPSTESLSRSTLARHRRAIEASLCVDSLAFFFQRAWRIIEPTRDLLPSFAIDGMCAAGQAVGEGRLRRLAVATCPGTSKSLFWAVAFPAWLELRTRGRARVMVGSYAWAFAERDATRCRDLVQSDWYRGLVAELGRQWEIREDANRKGDWWTTETGRRLITSVEGKSTGERCTWQLIDDALSAASIYSPADKAEAIRWAFEVLASRLEDQRVDPRVMVAQRLCVDDPIGEAIKRGWPLLCLPAVLEEGDTPCVLLDDEGVEIWRDTRAVGVPIVELLDIPTLERLRVELGSAAFNAQYLQKPTDDSSATIKRVWHRFYLPDERTPLDTPRPAGCDESIPAIAMPESFDRIVIGGDLSFGAIEGDYNAVPAWGARGSGRFLLPDFWWERAGFDEAKKAIRKIAAAHPGAKIVIEKAANGWAVIEDLTREIPGIVAVRPIGSKAQRQAAIVPTFESGCCYLPLGHPRLGQVVEEFAGATKHDDFSDASAYAIIDLNSVPRVAPQGGSRGTV